MTDDDTIFQTEGTLPGGRSYQAELWQLGASYHMTIFIPRLDGETAEMAANFIEESLIEFCGTKYRRVELVFVSGEPVWSSNVVVCDDEEQFISKTPLMHGLDTFSVWYGERQVFVRRYHTNRLSP